MSNIYGNMYKRDECYTTLAEAEKLVNYILENNLITKKEIIWMPFDNEYSNLYKAFSAKNFNIILSNLEVGLDFYFFEPAKYDFVISNPPFQNRSRLLSRLFSFDKPFIILQPTQFFNNMQAIKLLCSKELKFIFPENRMRFLTYSKKDNVIKTNKSSIAFYSFWLCYKIKLPLYYNYLKNSGKENQEERYLENGNIILDNQFTIFNYKNKNF